MAKKSQATRKSAEQAVSISRIRINQLFFESWLIIQGTLGLFVLISLLSFSPQDPGWSTQEFVSPLNEAQEINNTVGTWGAYISDFLYSFIGYMAFLIPIWLLYPVLKHFFFSKSSIGWPSFTSMQAVKGFGWALVVISGSTLLSIFIEPSSTFLPYEAGGIIGNGISSNTLEPLSYVGSVLIFLTFFLIGLTLSLEISWTVLINKVQEYLLKFGGNFGERISSLIDKFKDKQKLRKEKIQRQEKVIQHVKKKEKTKPAEVLEPAPKVEKSIRVEEEKQEELFDESKPSTPPKLSLLDEKLDENSSEPSEASLRQLGELVISKLSEYGINDVVVESIQPGPVVIRLELRLPSGLKVNQISNINKDLARSLAKTSVRIVEVIEGKDTIGIEVPREDRQPVLLSEVLSSNVYDEAKSSLTIALGKDISGSAIIADLASMPHLLVAGTTGSGKSVALNAMLISILYKATPEQVRLILIDPKMLELSVYEDIPHLLCPVITDMREASSGLRWCVNEMERRYKLMAKLGVRNLNGYNKKVRDAIKSNNPIPDPLWKKESEEDTSTAPDLEELPNIVLACLLYTSPRPRD